MSMRPKRFFSGLLSPRADSSVRAFASGTWSAGSATPALPVGAQPGDMLLLLIQGPAANPPAIPVGVSTVTPAGWTFVVSSGALTPANGNVTASVYARRMVAGDAAPVLAMPAGSAGTWACYAISNATTKAGQVRVSFQQGFSSGQIALTFAMMSISQFPWLGGLWLNFAVSASQLVAPVSSGVGITADLAPWVFPMPTVRQLFDPNGSLILSETTPRYIPRDNSGSASVAHKWAVAPANGGWYTTLHVPGALPAPIYTAPVGKRALITRIDAVGNPQAAAGIGEILVAGRHLSALNHSFNNDSVGANTPIHVGPGETLHLISSTGGYAHVSGFEIDV